MGVATDETKGQDEPLQDSLPLVETSQYPPAPNPSADPGVIPRINAAQVIRDERQPPDADFDVDKIEPILALKMLSRGIQTLSDITGDIPSTPPISRPSTPRLFDDQAPRLRRGSRPTTPPSRVPSSDMTVTTLNTMPIGSPEAHPSEPEAIDDTAIVKAQYDAISRKFYSRRPPPVSIHDYLLRLHRYCPMSTAVYLAAGVYIHRLAVEDNSVPVTLRTAHRLLLAALRVAMKALEDLNYPHKRFSGVGGVTEKELAKLEVSLCYLLEFNLRVDSNQLHEKARELQKLAVTGCRPPGMAVQLRMPVRVRGPRPPEPFQALAG